MAGSVPLLRFDAEIRGVVCASEGGVDLDKSLGCLLQAASSALRAAVEGVLRPIG